MELSSKFMEVIIIKFKGLIIFVLYENKKIYIKKMKSKKPAELDLYLQYIDTLVQPAPLKLLKVYVIKLGETTEYIWCSKLWRDNLDNKISPNHQKYLDFLKDKRQDVSFIGPYRGMRVKDLHLCKNGHEWRVAPMNVKKGTTCPYCIQKRKESNGAKFITQLLVLLNIEFIKEISLNRFSIDSSMRLDFLICKNNFPLFAIEFHGIQHYKNVSPKYFGGNKSLNERKKRDAYKKEICHQNCIPLLEIPYTFSDEEIEFEVKKYLSLFELI